MPTPRTPPPWRRAFLRELARSGSVKLAAEKCGLDPTYPYQYRSRNAAFAVSWERALTAARERLAEPGLRAPAEAGASVGRAGRSHPSATSPETPACAGDRDRPRKRPLLRPNETIRSSKTGKTCIMRTRPGRWDAEAEAAFLAELTATANVKAAARAAGVSTTAVYNRRKQWPAFKAQWDAAVAEATARLDTLVVCAATTTLDPEPLPERAYADGFGPERMSMDQAITVWRTLNARLHPAGKRRLGGPPRREPDIEEVRQEILRKVAAMERAEAAGLAER